MHSIVTRLELRLLHALRAITFCVSIAVVSPLPAQTEQLSEARLDELGREVAQIREELAEFQSSLDEQESAIRDARRAAGDAEYELRSAQRALESELVFSTVSRSAQSYLSETNAALNQLRDRRAALSDASSEEARVLDAQISGLVEQLAEEAARYGEQSNSRLGAIDAADQRVQSARERLAETQAGLEAALAEKEVTAQRIRALQPQLGELLEDMAAESDKVSPSWLETIEVRQQDEVVYRASWSPDGSVKQNLLEHIEGQQKQRAELLRIRELIEADIATYSRNADTARAALLDLIEDNEYYEDAVVISDRAWDIAQVAGLIATGAGLTKAIQVSVAESGVLFSRATLQAGYRQLAQEFSVLSVPGPVTVAENVSLWTSNAASYFGIAARAWSYEQALANSWRGTEAVAALLTTFQLGETGYRVQQGTFLTDSIAARHDDPDRRRFEGVLQRSLQGFESFAERHREILVRHYLRQNFATETDQRVAREFQNIQQAIDDEENDWWHTLLIGYITTSRAELEAARGRAAITFLQARQSGNVGLLGLAVEEIEELDRAVTEIDARLEELRSELAGPEVRQLTVEVNERLRITDEGEAQISLTFSQPLASAPSVKIGPGPAITVPRDNDPGDGLPAPEWRGAVMAEMSGASLTWDGLFPVAPLQDFIDAGDALQIEVTARDAAGRSLDANPRTAARRAPGNRDWSYNEPDFMASVLGQGGPDRWHEIRPIFEGGTSFVFVVDASGSMEDNGRMDRVQRSARAFVASMSNRDEIAAIAFFDCQDIRVIQPFTRRHDQVLTAIDALEPTADTPLAKAILSGGDYLLERSHFDERTLIILTDGQENCDGDHVAAAGLFRRQVNILGDMTNSTVDRDEENATTETTEADAGDEQPEDQPEEAVRPMPDDREAWRVEVTDGGTFPTVSLVQTRFREWAEDDGCAAEATESVYYTYYGRVWQPDGSSRTGFSVNSRPGPKRTLDFAVCSSGQARMDAIRARWANLDGTDYETAENEAQNLIDEVLSQ